VTSCAGTTDNEPFKDICTCWFKKPPGQTEIIGKAKSGKCENINYRPAWTYLENPDYQPENIVPKG
jgi:hypothetical protein